MPTSTQSLLSYLRMKNPRLDARACPPGKNTKSSSKADPWDQPKNIVKWRDFEYEALQSIYSGKLQELLEHSFELDNFTVPEIPFCRIHDEDSFESLVIKWNQSITSNALAAAQGHLRVRRAERIYMCKGGQARWPGQKNTRRRPDWAAVKGLTLNGTPMENAENVLPGDTKLSKKFSSNMINQGDIEEIEFDNKWYHPLSQIFTYCVRNNARYGYLITDEELVVIRVSPWDPSNWTKSKNNKARKAERKKVESAEPDLQARQEGRLEYESIPWNRHENDGQKDPSVMTVNLALWWLHVLAANDGAIKKKYPPLQSSEWNIKIDLDSPSSSFEISGDSQNRQSFTERNPDHHLRSLRSRSNTAGSKRHREVDTDGEDENTEYMGQRSPKKGKTRGRK